MCELHDKNEQETGFRAGITEFVDELLVSITNVRIYSPDHPRVSAAVAELARILRALRHDRGTRPIVLGVADGCLFYDKQPLLGASLTAPRLIEPLKTLGSGGLSFEADCDERDLRVVARLLSPRHLKLDSPDEANRKLDSEGCATIRFLPPYSADGGDGLLAGAHGFDPRGTIDVPMRTYQGIVDLLQDVMVRASSGEAIAVDDARGFVESVLSRLDEDPATMMSMGRYERYDAFTFGHSIRVGFLALNFARTFVTDEEQLHRIGIAALLHDVGKAWVPFEVLHSTGRLSDDERLQMNRHTEYGGQILFELAGGDPMIVAAAFGHHRTPDGGGYPSTVHDPELSTCTRIVKICDVYEALTAIRPYKDRMSPLRAYRIMMSMKGHFDLVLLRQFITRNGLYPDGSRVRLSTGDEARVVSQGAAVHMPVVAIEGAPEEDGTLDLGRDSGGTVSVEELLGQRTAA